MFNLLAESDGGPAGHQLVPGTHALQLEDTDKQVKDFSTTDIV